MSRMIPRISIIRPFTRLGFATSRPLIPTTQSIHAGGSLSYRAFIPPIFRRTLTSPPGSPTSSTSSSSSSNAPLPENATLSERLKFLIKRYGWYALGMYIFFSTLDFTLTFAAVNYMGAEYVEALVKTIKGSLPAIFPKPDETSEPEGPTIPKSGSESLWAMAVLSYTIHKLLLPVRVGLTATFTPRFVNWLAKRGWVGRDGAKRAASEVRDRMRRSSRDRE